MEKLSASSTAIKHISIRMNQLNATYKGVITAALMILASLISFYFLKNPVESNFQYVIYLLFTLGILWSVFGVNNPDNKVMTFKDFFSTGFKTFVVIALFMAIFTFIFFTFHTEFRDDKIAENTKLIIQEGNHLPNEIAENAKQLKKMFMPIMISSAVFRYLILGAIISAVSSAFLSQKIKQKNQSLFN